MAYEEGSVNEYLEPCIAIEFENGSVVGFMIDTGFNGSLCVPRLLMKELNLVKVSEEVVFGVGTYTDVLDLSTATI